MIYVNINIIQADLVNDTPGEKTNEDERSQGRKKKNHRIYCGFDRRSGIGYTFIE